MIWAASKSAPVAGLMAESEMSRWLTVLKLPAYKNLDSLKVSI